MDSSNVTRLPTKAAEDDDRGPSEFQLAYAKWVKACSDIAEIENTGRSINFDHPGREQQESD